MCFTSHVDSPWFEFADPAVRSDVLPGCRSFLLLLPARCGRCDGLPWRWLRLAHIRLPGRARYTWRAIARRILTLARRRLPALAPGVDRNSGKRQPAALLLRANRKPSLASLRSTRNYPPRSTKRWLRRSRLLARTPSAGSR